MEKEQFNKSEIGQKLMRPCSSLLKNRAFFLLPDLQKKRGLRRALARSMSGTLLSAIEIEIQLIYGFKSRAWGYLQFSQCPI